MIPDIQVPGPGQESVWSYPRPPLCQSTPKTLRIEHRGETIAETRSGFRVLETSHPPVYYFPPGDCRLDWLPTCPGGSFCEFKGAAKYVDLTIPGDQEREPVTIGRVGWYYTDPPTDLAGITGFLAFYAQKFDACFVDDQRVTPQPGQFY